jgi:hypothetical protein
MRTTRLLPALAVAALIPIALTGCGITDALQKRTSGTVATPAALEHAWRTPASQPDWVPADATDIRYIAATVGAADASPAAVRVDTTSALPDTCTEIERRSLDAFGEDWAPGSFPDRVERCGNWAVMKVDGGWFGWTPLAPAEADQ